MINFQRIINENQIRFITKTILIFECLKFFERYLFNKKYHPKFNIQQPSNFIHGDRFFLQQYSQELPTQKEMNPQKKEQIRKNRLKIKSSLLNLLQNPSNPNSSSNKISFLKHTSSNKNSTHNQKNYRQFYFLSSYHDHKVEEGFKEDFYLGKKIGEGAHSVIFNCVEKKSGDSYAVKVTRKNCLQLMQNIRESYQILKELDHEYILKGKYLYINQNRMISHMVSELCDYPDLRDFMTKTRHIPEEKIAEILNKIIEVVAYLNEMGVCHRDIKPQNILYNPQTNEIKLIDFELAKMQRYHHEKLDLWTRTGTRHYRAPETFQKGYTYPVDMWSVGVIAFEMLMDQLPFDSEYERTLMKQICQKEINFQCLPISVEAKSFLRKILMKNPNQRITAKEALSHPFLLKNTCSNICKKLNNSLDQIDLDVEEDEDCQSSKCYSEDTTFSFMHSLIDDIGIRVCQA